MPADLIVLETGYSKTKLDFDLSSFPSAPSDLEIVDVYTTVAGNFGVLEEDEVTPSSEPIMLVTAKDFGRGLGYLLLATGENLENKSVYQINTLFSDLNPEATLRDITRLEVPELDPTKPFQYRLYLCSFDSYINIVYRIVAVEVDPTYNSLLRVRGLTIDENNFPQVYPVLNLGSIEPFFHFRRFLNDNSSYLTIANGTALFALYFYYSTSSGVIPNGELKVIDTDTLVTYSYASLPQFQSEVLLDKNWSDYSISIVEGGEFSVQVELSDLTTFALNYAVLDLSRSTSSIVAYLPSAPSPYVLIPDTFYTSTQNSAQRTFMALKEYGGSPVSLALGGATSGGIGGGSNRIRANAYPAANYLAHVNRGGVSGLVAVLPSEFDMFSAVDLSAVRDYPAKSYPIRMINAYTYAWARTYTEAVGTSTVEKIEAVVNRLASGRDLSQVDFNYIKTPAALISLPEGTYTVPGVVPQAVKFSFEASPNGILVSTQTGEVEGPEIDTDILWATEVSSGLVPLAKTTGGVQPVDYEILERYDSSPMVVMAVDNNGTPELYLLAQGTSSTTTTTTTPTPSPNNGVLKPKRRVMGLCS